MGKEEVITRDLTRLATVQRQSTWQPGILGKKEDLGKPLKI